MSNCKLFIGGIDFNTVEDTLFKAFSAFGKVVQLRLIRDRETGKSKGFAFVTFSDHNEAYTAKMTMNGQTIDNRFIGVKWAKDKPDFNK